MRNVQMLIVSAVKLCKHCLQTASASGQTLETSVPQIPWATDHSMFSIVAPETSEASNIQTLWASLIH